ncbi:MAG: hypothetical protein HYY02_12300 [Chloroflexi bacterium]|nr:hypothetical protein [Chloroflexota bacterium]
MTPPGVGVALRGTQSRPALVYVGALTAYVLVAGKLDAVLGDLFWQNVVGGLTWLFVVAALWRARPEERLAVGTMIGVATLYECFGSLVWRMYEYRMGNLPLYVPPGHGLFYLAAFRLAGLPALRSRARTLVSGVLLGSALWAIYGALLAPHPDRLGLYAWFLLAAFLVRGRDPLFFAISFVATMALEYYGTAIGTWAWATQAPVLGISAANPPSAIGAGYCVMDATTQLLLPHLRRALARLGKLRRCLAVAAQSTS